MLAKARTRDSMQALGKLTTVVDGRRRIVSDPPLIVPVEELFTDMQADAVYDLLRTVLAKYRRTLQSDRRHLLDQFDGGQVARKVVGVGSVGTRAWIVLLGPATATNRCSCRPRRPSPRSWPTTAGAASTPTRASGSSPGST